MRVLKKSLKIIFNELWTSGFVNTKFKQRTCYATEVPWYVVDGGSI